MQVTVEDQNSVKKILHIEVAENEVARELDDAYKQLKKTAKIKGFRPGKAPRSVLEGKFKKDVHADVTSRLIQSSFMEAMEETKLDIIGQPKVDPPELDPKGPYKYDATVEIKPEIEDIDFKALPLTKTLYKASDEEVTTQIEMLRKNQAKLEVIEDDRPVKEEDAVLIDYEGFKDDKPFEKLAKTENHTLKIGSGQISDDFDKKLIGKKAGDSIEFEIHFPKDHFNKELAELDITFKVTIKEIREEILPEIDDAFAKSLGPFDSLDALKEKIKENLSEGYEKRTEQELNEQIFTALIEKTSFELPDLMVEYELEMIIQDAFRSFEASNVSAEQLGLTRETLSEKYRDVAEKQVQRHLILGKIVQQENLSISDQELEESYEDITKLYQQPLEEIKKFYKENPDKLEFFKHTLLEKKAIKLIVNHGIIDEKEPEPDKEAKK